MVLGHFLTASLEHFQFSVAEGPFFEFFWPEEGRFLTFFTE